MLSWISMFGVAIGTMALIVVLSVFNGLGNLLETMYSSYDADFKIVPKEGKSFSFTSDQLGEIVELPGVKSFSKVIEDNAVAVYRDQQAVVGLRGVEETYIQTNKLDTFLRRGEIKIRENDRNLAVLGAGLAYELGVILDSRSMDLELIYPRNLRPGAMLSTNSVRRTRLAPVGVISIDVALDESLLLTSLDAVSRILDYDNRYTAVEVYLSEEANPSSIEKRLQQIAGDGFDILDSNEQHGDLIKVVKFEKLFTYLALSFITLIASFNIFFSLSMLAIEKRRDMAVLFAVGAPAKLIKQIFFKQGMLIACIGAVFGMLCGLLLCYLQDTYGLVGLGMANAVVQAYPVKVIWTDVVLVAASITLITIATSYRPALLASRINPIEFLD